MPSPRKVDLLVGTAGSSGVFSTPTVPTITSYLEILTSHGIAQLDSAASYPAQNPGGSETILGECNASEKFAIDTKVFITGLGTPEMAHGSLTRQMIRKSMDESLARLKTKSVKTFYCHLPDKVTPLKETVAAMDELSKEGKFERVCKDYIVPSLIPLLVRLMESS